MRDIVIMVIGLVVLLLMVMQTRHTNMAYGMINMENAPGWWQWLLAPPEEGEALDYAPGYNEGWGGSAYRVYNEQKARSNATRADPAWTKSTIGQPAPPERNF